MVVMAGRLGSLTGRSGWLAGSENWLASLAAWMMDGRKIYSTGLYSLSGLVLPKKRCKEKW